MERTDLIIIGAGTLGTFHAKAALELGLSVRLCERDAAPQNASVRNFGQVVPSGMTPKWQAFGRRSLAIYKALQQETDISVRHHGSVYLASDPEEWRLLEELWDINRANGYPSELLSRDKCLARYPGLRADYCVGGLFFPEEITVEAREMIHRVLAYLQNRYARLSYQPGTAIKDLEVRGMGGETHVWAKDTRGNEYRADRAIVCSGTEFKLLFPERFAASDLVTVKLQMLQTAASNGPAVPGNILTGLSIRRYEAFGDCPSWASVKASEDPGAYWKKWSIHILFKQCPDGSFILGDSHEYAAAAAADQLGFDAYSPVNDYMIREAQKIFALPTWELQRTWTGYYAQCATQDIYHETIDGRIHVVTGIGGKGMTAGPGYAEAHIKELYPS
ncbi:TIGR03364 family FAD-dependent oxidoreductase [Neolewinella lacunae]|uniref:TIGR03364 family FAD-dependent oxidoreductase n=1 Tax=Neolewinella lacunae TaxID=1517758 RepID=A0A923T7C2_9BACT|nr:TIGR03364 family FAD-dependent oxidoreductase [Neolewinella lacunae]MBC6994345.1 TIGR03364 family FAD-dependent oxidoreductase [Neolewinella lacunae]MDN3635808.1 TIGR03364 family FAD-dependent oxidoreductase [Neolewinella lacunae]